MEGVSIRDSQNSRSTVLHDPALEDRPNRQGWTSDHRLLYCVRAVYGHGMPTPWSCTMVGCLALYLVLVVPAVVGTSVRAIPGIAVASLAQFDDTLNSAINQSCLFRQSTRSTIDDQDKIDDADRRNISQLKAAIGAEGVEVGEKWLSGAVSATLEDFLWTPDNYRNHIITFLAIYSMAPTGFFTRITSVITDITREKFVEAAKVNGSPYYTTGSMYKFAALLEELVNPGSKIALDLVEAASITQSR